MKDFIKYEELTRQEHEDILRDFCEMGDKSTLARWHIAPGTLRKLRFENQKFEAELLSIRAKKPVKHRESSMIVLTENEKTLRPQVQALREKGFTSGEAATMLGWKLEDVNRMWI